MAAGDSNAKPRKAMDPDRLRKLMDSPSIANDTRNVPISIVRRQTLVTSWNGEQCDVRAFEKLAPPTHVVLAKDLRECTIGGRTGVALARSGLQMNDIAVRPPDDQLQNFLTAPLLTTKESFAHVPQIEHRAVPASVLLQEGLMTPQQRRERLQFETTHQSAKRAIHQADMNDRRLHQIMCVLFNAERCVDSCCEADFVCVSSKERHSTCDVLSTAHDSSGCTPRMRGEPFKPDLLSAQHLRNESTGGRPYGIVNGGCVEYFPPTIPEKQHPWQAHPSVAVHRYTR
ncbi:hypothetical protein BBJ28_00019809 [Nothophytophthora sp. Chile5]|nr:hypothetical protein BBJ28_00019809 [Nothophytophthora sp. Chile5]